MLPRHSIFPLLWLCLMIALPEAAFAQRIAIPRRHDKPPGPPVSAEEAVKKMTVPEGFSVEIVAAEPDVVNPVAMTIDERGRFWIAESLEYPRRSPGKGRDRVKILEDTNGDGRADKVTVFAEGLNIPSGIAVGYGGVWVANAPDILFLQDTDGDGKADKQEVVVTGFGRTDTHELPNSLTWGPDGWLYGLNGVFNHSHVQYAKENPNYDATHPGWKFTCAMFRIHPRTRAFQVFAEGTSNPWGIAFNDDGEAFISACVIDHLWHITETGYYHRQGGPYPPHTWKIESIVEHTHQKAAYCGLEYFDSNAYPEKYRGLLYMGNIHGGCINVDKLQPRGSTYFATPEPDFLTANDAWFMPVVQKTGPDGCLYILDWYDRYHCYQDANADPEGIDRLRGRLYRVRYKDTPRVHDFDVAKESDEQLIKRLGSANVYDRTTAQRILQERGNPKTAMQLLELAADAKTPENLRRHAFWAAIGGRPAELVPGSNIATRLIGDFLRHRDPVLRMWTTRYVGDSNDPFAIANMMPVTGNDESPVVRLQSAIAITKAPGSSEPGVRAHLSDREFLQMGILLGTLQQAGDDPLTPRIVWQNLHPLLEEHLNKFLELIANDDYLDHNSVAELMPRVFDRILDRQEFHPEAAATLFSHLRTNDPAHPEIAGECLARLATRVQTGQIKGDPLAAFRKEFSTALKPVLSGSPRDPLYRQAALLSASWRDPAGLEAVSTLFADSKVDSPHRLQALAALISAEDDRVLASVADVLSAGDRNSAEFRGQVIASLGRLNDPRVADVLLASYAKLEPELQPRVVELLTQRIEWSRKLIASIGDDRVPQKALNLNQIRRLLSLDDAELTKAVHEKWGTIRDERNPEREQLIAEMKQFIRQHPGDAYAGEKVFKKVCAQCHKMYGEGTEVGPDITRNGRNAFEQLLSNVFDPSLVIGAAYRAHMVATADGRVLTGLLVEDSPQRVVLRVQGGKLETIARDDVELFKSSEVSMMPEDLEKQLKPEEIADLFAFLTLDRHPRDPDARQLPGVREITPRETDQPPEFESLIAEVAPGFTTRASGEGGVALLAEHRGRATVVRTHPVNQSTPCVLTGNFHLPAGTTARLHLGVSHHEQGDWQLIIRGNGRILLDRVIGPKTTTGGWAEFTVDLSKFAGETVKLELVNHPNNWAWEFAYWGRAAVLVDE